MLYFLVLTVIKPCIGDVASFTNPDHLKSLKQSKVQEEMLSTYDINKDETISWGEFNIGNSILKKELPYARTIFRFFDKNHDWKISKKELTRVKVRQLATYIGSGGKRRKWFVNLIKQTLKYLFNIEAEYFN